MLDFIGLSRIRLFVLFKNVYLFRCSLVGRSKQERNMQKNISLVTSSHKISSKNFESKSNCHEKLVRNLSFGVYFKL